MTHYGIGIAGVVIGFLMALLLLLVLGGLRTPPIWKRLAYHFGLYVVDIVLVLTGFILGFGLEVRSWFWVLVPALVGRFVIHMFNTVMISRDIPVKKAPGETTVTPRSTPIQGASVEGLMEDIRDEDGTILWSEPYVFGRLRVQGDRFHFNDRPGEFEVVTCERQPSGTIATTVRRVS